MSPAFLLSSAAYLRYALFISTLSSLSLVSCRDARLVGVGPECNVRATIRDLTALDGCGFVFELPNGIRLSPTNAVWQDFTPYEGQQVLIRYQDSQDTAPCRVGRPVRITCITESQQ